MNGTQVYLTALQAMFYLCWQADITCITIVTTWQLPGFDVVLAAEAIQYRYVIWGLV